MAIIDSFTEDELREIVAKSSCLKDVIKKIGYTCTSGSNNNTVRKRLKRYNISTEHFYHKEPIKRNKENIFIKDSTASQKTLRFYYTKYYPPLKCSICGQPTSWNSKDLIMVLDHINGDKHDDRIENLRWVCPNCNSQLDTFAGRKLRKNI